MQNLSIKQQYSIAALIQLIALILFFAVSKLILNIETVVLNPIPYFIIAWVSICAINAISLIIFVFRGETTQNNLYVEKGGK